MTDTTPRADAPAPRTRRGLAFLENYALVFLTAIVFLAFTLNPASAGTFPTINNMNVVLGSQSVVALIGIAALFPLVCNYFDFSLGAVAAMAQVLAAGLMAQAGLPLWLACVVPIIVAGVVGALNGFFVMKLQMSPFVTTLAMGMLITGLMTWYTNGQTIISGIDPAMARFGSMRWLGLPVVFFIVLLVAAAAWYFLTHTPYGRSLYAVGSNANAAKLVGVPVTRNVWWSFVTASAIAGGAGVLNLARMGSASASAGNELLFPALAAVFLGATVIRPGFFNVIGTLVGAIFVSLVVSGLTLSGASGWASGVFNGLALLVAVGLSTFLGRRKRAGG